MTTSTIHPTPFLSRRPLPGGHSFFLSRGPKQGPVFSQKQGGIKHDCHRPNKLWGYNLESPQYQALQKRFEAELLAIKATDAWTGMALGADTVFARAVLKLRDAGTPIRLHCAIPCQNHSSRWLPESKQEYNRILSLADEVHLVTDAPYAPALMQRRNEYMVDRADLVLALWDGTCGGTGNCIRYARQKHVSLFILDPKEFG